MAKTGFYLYGTRGKVGNLVARKGQNGGTILSERVFSPKNPQTNLQMAQRIILATVAQAAKYLTPIVDHSFQGYGVGAQSKQKFRKENMDFLRALAAVDFAENPSAVDANVFMTTKGISALIPNAYIISQGNLSNHKLKITTAADGADGYKFEIALRAATVSLNGSGTEKRAAIGDIIKGLFGLTLGGEQLTFVSIQRTGEGYQYAYDAQPDMPGWEIPYTAMHAARLVIDPAVDLTRTLPVITSDGTASSTLRQDIIDAIISVFSVSPKTDGTLLSQLRSYLTTELDEVNVDTATAASIYINASDPWNFTDANIDTEGNGYIYALGIIRSRLMTDGSWQYSNTRMTLARPTTEIATNFGLDWNSAIGAWFEKREVATNELYLHAGTDENAIGESFT